MELERAARQEPAPAGADMFRFEVEIDEAGTTRTLQIVDDGNPDRADRQVVDDLISIIQAG